MKTRVLALMLVLGMIVCLFAACGGSGSSAAEGSEQSAPEAASDSASAAEEAAEAASAPEAEASETEAAPEATPESMEVEAVAEELAEIELEPMVLPISGTPVTLSYFQMKPGGAAANYMPNGYEDSRHFQKAAEVTGVTLDFIQPDMMVANEQFNLRIAAQDYPDIFGNFNSMYTDGEDHAIEEEIILALEDYEDLFPYYTKYRTSTKFLTNATLTFTPDPERCAIRATCTVKVDGVKYKMITCNFPTVDPKNPNKLTPEEEAVMRGLHSSFVHSDKLQRHMRTMLAHGCMYAIYNNNLLFHASVPLNPDGTLKEVELYDGKRYSGKELMHNTGLLLRSAFQQDTDPKEKAYAIDYFLYMWCGPDSVLFDKAKMATFERYFLTDKEPQKEAKGIFFNLRDNEKTVDYILDSFGVTGENRHIITGHVPVHVTKGEKPVKANGKMMVIDGGFSRAYHKETGIAGYTLVYHSRGFELVQHEPFPSADDVVRTGADIKGTTMIVEMSTHRMKVADTDKGAELKRQISDLKNLLYAYRHGFIKENR